MRRLLAPARSVDPDLRPGLLSIACLLLILLPCLLLTTSLYKLASLPFRLGGAEGTRPPEIPGLVTGVEVRMAPDGMVLRAALRTRDANAAAEDVVWNETDLPDQDGVPDIPALQARLEALKRIDPAWKRVTVLPEDPVSTDDVVLVMDALREGPAGPLAEEILLGEGSPPLESASPPDAEPKTSPGDAP
ncbi:MAG: hypothetical protein JXB39_10350 [Deltaproteobacteria bacterium]|nr:hypothetical protein [Deltaproteobacteria bacterium]